MNEQKNPLVGLYPFLHEQKINPQQHQAELLESVKQKAAHSIQTKQTFFAEQSEQLVAAAQTLATCYKRGGKLLSMGNGGSSCDASHVAVEFQHPVTAGRPSLPAINLTTDVAFISALANDVGVESIFARQIEAQATSGDVLIGFSTSGNSHNLIAGFRKARQMGVHSIGFAGGNGGQMLSEKMLDHCLVVNTDSIHRVQEVHVACYHILWDLTHTLLADNRGKLSQNMESEK